MFPILGNGSLGNPIAGSFFPHLQILDDVHQVQLNGIESLEGDCMLKIKYSVAKKKDLRYRLKNNILESPFTYQQGFPVCNRTIETNLKRPHQGLLDFFQYVDSLIYGNNILANQTSFEGYQVLWHLMPLSEGVDENKALKLISN